MAADAYKLFNLARLRILDGTILLGSHTFKCALVTSAWTPNLESNGVWADISGNEVANGNGYTTGGQVVTLTLSRSTVTVTCAAGDPVWTASGAGITARYAVIYDDTPTSPADPLLCYTLLDNTPANVSVTAGNTLTIDNSNLFTLTGMS